jgi:hypothetical protein
VSEVVDFLRTPDGLPRDYLNEPWDCEIGPDGKLYWTNFGNSSIYRCNLDGTGIEPVIQGTNISGVQRLQYYNQAQVDSFRAMHLVDGPVGVASCTHPTAMGFNSQGKLIWIDNYLLAIRELDLTTQTVQTLAFIPGIQAGSSGASTRQFAMSIDTEGTCGPKDDIFINGWHNSDHRFAADGTYVGRAVWTSGAIMCNGPLDKVKAPGYAWGIGVGDGLIRVDGNGAGYESIYVRKRQPEDGPDPDVTLWKTGQKAYQAVSMFLTHGADLQGHLGFPTGEELGALSDSDLDAYLTDRGIPATSLAAVRYYIRWNVRDVDYTVPEPPPPPEPDDLEFSVGGRLYHVQDVGPSSTEDRVIKMGEVGYTIVGP